MFRELRKTSIWIAAVAGLATLTLASSADAAGPGDGKTVQPISTGRADHYFQHFVVQIGLERLGYKVKDHLEAQFPAMHVAIGQGDADYTAVHWEKLHIKFFDNAGGEKAMQRVGMLIPGALQGYLIDKATADKHKITNLGQLKDPAVAKIFDSAGDGKAHLTGCNPGWGCERVIEHQLDAFGLRGMVQHEQGEYFALIADTITRYKAGKPILYYTWTPLWVSSVLRPGVDTVWLDVPFTSLPKEQEGQETKLPNGRNPGFVPDNIRVVANNKFLAANPAAKRFFELATLPIEDVNAAILRLQQGESKVPQIRAHAEEWVKKNEATFQRWVTEAAAAK